MKQTPIDEYNFWKQLIEDKYDKCEFIPARMYEYLSVADIKKQDYLNNRQVTENNLTIN
jgi:hypothetical protein